MSTKTKTIIAFDFGTKNIGVAIGQTITLTSQPLLALQAKDGIPNWNEIEEIIKNWKPNLLIVGLPLNIDGTEQDLTFRAKKFGNRLRERFKLDVQFCDERLTTVEAKQLIFNKHGFKGLNKNLIDSVSASFILQSWLDSNY